MPYLQHASTINELSVTSDISLITQNCSFLPEMPVQSKPSCDCHKILNILGNGVGNDTGVGDTAERGVALSHYI